MAHAGRRGDQASPCRLVAGSERIRAGAVPRVRSRAGLVAEPTTGLVFMVERDIVRHGVRSPLFSAELSISRLLVCLIGDHLEKEGAMKYVLLIHQGDSPTPRSPEAWATLSEDEQKAVYADYQAVNQTPGVTTGLGLDAPETATTVRVQDGKTLTTDGPFVETKEALG